jgi:hypothetical protein
MMAPHVSEIEWEERVLAPWYIRSQNPCISKNGCAKEPAPHRMRWQDSQIPDETSFQTKHELAAQLVEKVMADGRLKAR